MTIRNTALTLCHMHRVARKARPLPHEPALLGQQTRHLAADELVARRPAAVWVQPAGVGNVPRPGRGPVIVRLGRRRRPELGLPGRKGVAVKVLLAPHGVLARHGVDGEDGVLGPVDVGIDAQAE